MSSIGRGYIHVYTGDGKGKTTAALGLAVRAAGRGFRVLIIQFLKGGEMTGERRALEHLSPGMTIRSAGRDDVFLPGDISDTDRKLAREAFESALSEMESGCWDVLVLDELNTSCALDLVPLEDVLELMRKKPDGLELIITGRSAPPEVVEKADLVTEMKEIKHYFRKGVPAREGIEK